jgi:hypothetical protein
LGHRFRGTRALTRDISAAIARCELTHLARVAIDIEIARRQHEAYERALSDLGCTVHRLAAGAGDDEMPDSGSSRTRRSCSTSSRTSEDCSCGRWMPESWRRPRVA